jgi:transcriptional regulator with XRE-family HTH domain
MAKSAAQIFREARRQQGLTQVEVAKNAGLFPNTYSLIEQGKQIPKFATVKKIAKALGISLDDIPA